MQSNTRKISDFFKNELTDYSSYSTLRMISSCVDGLKNSHRKIIYTALNKLNSSIKVSQFDSRMQEYTQYLHGSATNVISNIAADYTGSNNLPLLKGNGNFGSRMVPEPSAPRYIYVENQKYINDIFDIQDVLLEQHFEGDKIEPRFFVPSVPLLLINGSMSGLASGFKQHILPRNIKEIYKYYEGKKCDLTPYFKGFKGKIYPGPEHNQWIIEGVITRDKNKVIITEIPIQYDYAKYLKILDDLVEQKKIKDYTDNSDTKKQIFNFEVKLYSDTNQDILDLLKLRTKETENLNAIDISNKVKAFDSIEQILEYYKIVRIKFQERQRVFDLENQNKKLNILNSKYKFISLIIDQKLKIYKRSKQDIKNDLESTDISKEDDYEYLLKMPVHSFTNETLEQLKNQIQQVNITIQNLTTQDNKTVWMECFDKVLKAL